MFARLHEITYIVIDMTSTDTRQRSYMALAPLGALAAIFIAPLASTVIPLIIFFIFRNKRSDVATVALQTADLAFSVQLWIILASLALLLGISLDVITTNNAQSIMTNITLVILVLFVASLLVATYRAIQGLGCRHLFSFKIAEKVLRLSRQKKSRTQVQETE